MKGFFMLSQDITHISLSVDETALLFSLMDQAETGKIILSDTYGEITPETLENKLTAASHSLLARQFVAITNDSKIQIKDEIQKVFLPLIQFKNILQLTKNTNNNKFEICNMYISLNNYFTALSIVTGVVYEFFHGSIENIGNIIKKYILFPENLSYSDFFSTHAPEIVMSDFSNLNSLTYQDQIILLSKTGLPQNICKTIIKSLQSQHSRGSVIITDINSDNYHSKNVEEAGGGFIYTIGSESSWLLNFDQTNDRTKAKINPGTISQLDNEITRLIKLLG